MFIKKLIGQVIFEKGHSKYECGENVCSCIYLYNLTLQSIPFLENKIYRVKNIGRTKLTSGLLCGEKTGHFKCQLTSNKITQIRKASIHHGNIMKT